MLVTPLFSLPLHVLSVFQLSLSNKVKKKLTNNCKKEISKWPRTHLLKACTIGFGKLSLNMFLTVSFSMSMELAENQKDLYQLQILGDTHAFL